MTVDILTALSSHPVRLSSLVLLRTGADDAF